MGPIKREARQVTSVTTSGLSQTVNVHMRASDDWDELICEIKVARVQSCAFVTIIIQLSTHQMD